MNFTHLHVHSQYSILDGMSKIPDLVEKCRRCDMNALALTDHGNMYGIKEFLDYVKKINGKPKNRVNEQKELIEKTKEKGQDTADLEAKLKALEVEAASYVPFKPIVGVEAYCARRSRLSKDKNVRAVVGDGREIIVDSSGWHLILLAKNKKGYQNLCKIVSDSFIDGFYNRPRIDKQLLEEYHEGIIVSTACLGGELCQLLMAGNVEEAEASARWFKSIFGDDYYIEVMRHQTTKPGADQNTYQHQKAINPILMDIAKKLDIKVIATNDVHFVEEEHAEAHDRLICVSTNKDVSDPNRMHYTKQEWLKSKEEMAAIFSDIPEVLENTQEIVDKIEVFDIDSDPIMPKFDIPESFGTEEEYRQKITEQELFDEFTRDEHGNVVLSQADAEKKIKKLGGYDRLYRIKLEADYLAKLAWDGAKVRYGDELTEEQRERIIFELHIMKTMGFPGYFLIVMDFIRAAREELGVSVGPGRGSAAGSVVAYCLHITDLDPLKYDLLFERFLNPDRISLPDIDTDFDDSGRGKVLDWVSNKYGKTHVAHIITYGTMGTKSVLADVGRVQRVPLQQVNDIKSLIPDEFPTDVVDEKGNKLKINLKNCYQHVPALNALLHGSDPNVSNMLHYAEELENTVRQVGIHACGVIIGADDLTKFAPLSTVKDKVTGEDVMVTQYDGHVVESVGLIKMDFLGLKTLTVIKECLRLIKRARGEDVDIDHISLEDPDTFKLFQEGRTIAVFQFESPGMQKYMRELQPTVIGDLIAMNALYRPGPLEYIPSFIRRKHGQEKIKYDIPIMEKYLKDTYGVTVYQEQVMLLSRLLANFTRGQSDKLRKAMGKKQMAILQELKGKFIEGGVKNGHDVDVLEKIWRDWEAFASYAFNKSHAACYAWVAYQTAYLKAHYTPEFMAANLTVEKNDISTITKYMDECKSLHLSVLGPDVNESELNFNVNSEGNIRFGLGGVKGVGEGAVEAIVSEREKNGKFKSIFDFVERVKLTACNKKTMESLAMSGAFDCLGVYREQLVGYNSKNEYVLDTLLRYGNLFQTDKNNQQNSLFGGFEDNEIEIKKPELPLVEQWSTIVRLNREKDLIGIYLSQHPLDDYAFELHELANISATDVEYFQTIRRKESRSTMTEENQIKAVQFLQQHQRMQFSFGGILTKVETRIMSDQKTGQESPYGVYTLEDYSGTTTIRLYGKNYTQWAGILVQNQYVFLSVMFKQRGQDTKYYKELPAGEAEWYMQVTEIRLLSSVKKEQRTLLIELPLETLSDSLVNSLSEKLSKHEGKTEVKILVSDLLKKHVFRLNCHKSVTIDKDLYAFLCDNRDKYLQSLRNSDDVVQDSEASSADSEMVKTKEKEREGFLFEVK